jgi:hypothetical protein
LSILWVMASLWAPDWRLTPAPDVIGRRGGVSEIATG